MRPTGVESAATVGDAALKAVTVSVGSASDGHLLLVRLSATIGVCTSGGAGAGRVVVEVDTVTALSAGDTFAAAA